jgi:hypothetical protein
LGGRDVAGKIDAEKGNPLAAEGLPQIVPDRKERTPNKYCILFDLAISDSYNF